MSAAHHGPSSHGPQGLGGDAAWVAEATGARRLGGGERDRGPARVVIDSREAGPGDLFVGIPGERTDGGRFAAQVLDAGAWGVLCTPEHARAVADARLEDGGPGSGVVLAHHDPVAALGALARAWRRELRATVIGVTGSVGKTSTKDLLQAMLLPHRPTVATPQNLNTEIGLPLTVLAAPRGTEVLVLEMAMRGTGQIAQLGAIAEPDVGLITNIGPVHLEQLGSIEAIAAEKAAVLAALPPGGTAIVPAGEHLLDPHLRADVTTVRFGPGGDVEAVPDALRLPADLPGPVRANALAAVAAARAVGVEPEGDVAIALSAMRGQRLHLAGDVTVVVDCYNANPMSMRAALDDLVGDAGAVDAPAAAPGDPAVAHHATVARADGDGEAPSHRTFAVLGEMRELGPDARRYHAEVGAHAAQLGVDRVVAVGELARHVVTGYGRAEVSWVPDAETAAELVPTLVEPGDTVLLKASRGVGLEVVAEALERARPAAGPEGGR